jgi:hypothetical protein
MTKQFFGSEREQEEIGVAEPIMSVTARFLHHALQAKIRMVLRSRRRLAARPETGHC